MSLNAGTFPQTQTILNGVNVPNVRLDDIQSILNMRDAWRYLLDTAYKPVTLEYFCKLNEFIARNEALEWSRLRTGTVGIPCKDYTPQVPKSVKVAMELDRIVFDKNSTVTEKALEIFAWGVHRQFF